MPDIQDLSQYAAIEASRSMLPEAGPGLPDSIIQVPGLAVTFRAAPRYDGWVWVVAQIKEMGKPTRTVGRLWPADALPRM